MKQKIGEENHVVRCGVSWVAGASGVMACLIATTLLFSFFSAEAQAPGSIAGKTFGVGITDGDNSIFAGSGFYLFVPANSGNGYQVFNDDGTTETGTYASYSASGSTATATLSDSAYPGLPIYGKFFFSAPLWGTNSLTADYLGYSAYQHGNFIMFTNPVPSSISGQNFYVDVQSGNGPYAPSGGFVFATANSGTAYTITALSAGSTNSSGSYSYSRPNTTCGALQLTDTVAGRSKVYMAFTNSTSGGYYLTSSNGYQSGYITLLNSQAPSSIAGSTFIAAVSTGTSPFASGGYFLFLPASSGNNYQLIGIGNVAGSSGTYSYSCSGSAGTVSWADSLNGSVKGNFFYFSPLDGSYALSAGSSGQYTQAGDFAVLTNPAPSSISGQSFYMVITNGAYPYADNGRFIFSTKLSGNGYSITSLSDSALNSTGTYSYSRLNTTCGGIQLTDYVAGASSVYVAFSNSIYGGYVLTQPSSGGFQVGSVTPLNTEITITSPTSSSSYQATSGNLNVSGTASDTLGIAKITWSNNRGGNGIATGTTSWIVNGISLQAGTNVITLTAYDTVSNAVLAILTVTYNPPDAIPPNLTITSPTTGLTYVTNVSNVYLGGSASDNVGVSQITWSNNRGGSGVATGTSTWNIADVILQTGTNIISVTAHDAAGNSSYSALTIIYEVKPPTITITSPTTSSVYTNYSANISLGGTTADNVGVVQVSWSNSRGGSGTAIGTAAWNITGIPLQPGVNLIVLVARDQAGNTSQATITVINGSPTLDFKYAGNQILLMWPTNASDYALQYSSALSATAVWSSSFSPTIIGNNYVVTNSILNGAKFYRLKK